MFKSCTDETSEFGAYICCVGWEGCRYRRDSKVKVSRIIDTLRNGICKHLAGGVKLALILIGNNVVNQSGLTPLNCSCQPIGLTFYINNDSLTDHTTCSCQPIGIDVLSCWLDRRVT
jgi:hypothetical protein